MGNRFYICSLCSSLFPLKILRNFSTCPGMVLVYFHLSFTLVSSYSFLAYFWLRHHSLWGSLFQFCLWSLCPYTSQGPQGSLGGLPRFISEESFRSICSGRGCLCCACCLRFSFYPAKNLWVKMKLYIDEKTQMKQEVSVLTW